jgi:hypothetical protein
VFPAVPQVLVEDDGGNAPVLMFSEADGGLPRADILPDELHLGEPSSPRQAVTPPPENIPAGPAVKKAKPIPKAEFVDDEAPPAGTSGSLTNERDEFAPTVSLKRKRRRPYRDRPDAGFDLWGRISSYPGLIICSAVLYIFLTVLAACFLTMAYVCAGTGLVCAMGGVFWMAAIMMFEESNPLLALGVIFVPFVSIYVLITYFDQTRHAFLAIVVGNLLFFSGWVVGGLGERDKQFWRKRMNDPQAGLVMPLAMTRLGTQPLH